jgi:HD superfamily phosphohydrolase
MSLSDQIEEFVAEHLPDDFAAWCKQYGRPKIVHDALWGTFQLRPHEVALLDTPVVQRLRALHQTGAVYLTYPSAHHTRFEHTLGVVCQSGRLCDALQRSDEDESRIDTSLTDDVRLAAMLHDTGHGPFSHTSEQFYASMDEMETYQQQNPELQRRGAGEILSYLIVRSDSMRKFVDVLSTTYKRKLDCDRISRLITARLTRTLGKIG